MKSVSPAELNEILNNKKEDICLVDVREVFEFEEGHIEGAINIPTGKIMENIEELKKKDKVYFICLTGSRSAMVTGLVESYGIDAIDVSGGMMVWQMNMFPIVN